MNTNAPHDASGQFIGYLYQALASLLLLFENKEPKSQICLEKFDDVAFVEKDRPSVMIQTKHQLHKQGNLLDTSVDLWRTIQSWCDAIKADSCNLADTDFIIITTALVPEGTASSYLSKSHIRDSAKALTILQNVAKSHGGQTNKKFYESFLSLDLSLQDHLVSHTYVYGNSPAIYDIKKDLMRYVRCATLPIHEEKVYEKTIGWWFASIIECLCSPEPVYINRDQLQSELYDIGSQYKADSLPIDIDFYYDPSDDEMDELSPENRIFIEQLKLISISNDRLKRCIRDYYNAFRQRSLWVREQLLFVNELAEYEAALIDEWNRLYLIMKENLEDYGSELNSNHKEKAGHSLFGKIEELNKPIRERVNKTFIMRGTYHELANQLKVGWHVDFMDRLCHLLGGN